VAAATGRHIAAAFCHEAHFYNWPDMNSITRCPTCATTFKVAADQLRISDGWVRCGRCGEVFDAPLNLRDVPELEVVPELAAMPPADSLDPAAEIDEPSNAPARTVIDAQWWQNQPSLDMPVAVADVATHVETGDATRTSIEKVTGTVEAPVMTFRATVDEGISADTTRSNPAFMPGFLKTKAPDAPRPSRTQGWLIVLVVIALVALLMQVVFHERDFIAARQPTLKSLLTSLCSRVGCEISAPRQIASITVDGVSFSREPEGRGDGYSLYFSLRNRAGMALKMPAVELTLLDAQERPVLRRVLVPNDFGAPTVLPPHAERTASLVLTLSGAEAAALPPLAGYHVEPFYP